MKKVFNVTLALLLLISLTACNEQEPIDVTPDVTDKQTQSTVMRPMIKADPSWGILDNVSSITIKVMGFDLTINDKESINAFIDDIRVIEEADEVEPNYEVFKEKGHSKEELDKVNYFDGEVFYGESNSLEDEELLDFKTVELLIKYGDERISSTIYEFINGHTEVYANGDGMKIIYNDKITHYKNKDNVIARKAVDMIKDTLYYVQIYDIDGNYLYTSFLQPIDVKTNDYTIKETKWFQKFLPEYWMDFISKQEFTLYNYDEVIDELPKPKDETVYDIKLVDKNGNTFQLKYDQTDTSSKCKVDDTNPSKYYCEY